MLYSETTGDWERLQGMSLILKKRLSLTAQNIKDLLPQIQEKTNKTSDMVMASA